MSDAVQIGAVVGALSALAGLVGWILTFRRNLQGDIESNMNKRLAAMQMQIDKKVDSVVLESAIKEIKQAVSSMQSSVTDFMRRQDKHNELFYKQHHDMEEKFTELRIEQARQRHD